MSVLRNWSFWLGGTSAFLLPALPRGADIHGSGVLLGSEACEPRGMNLVGQMLQIKPFSNVKTKSSPSYGTQEQHAQPCTQVSWSLQLHEVLAPGSSLPYLCFPCDVPSPVCNHTPVQRKAILDNCELNTDSSCVGVKGASQTSGMMVQSISSLWHSSIGQGQGMCSPPLSPVPGVGVEAWNCLCLRLLAWVGGKAYYKNSEPSSSDDSRQCFLCRWW